MTGASMVVPDPDDAFIFEGAARGELLIRRCAACHRLRHPPTPMCPVCHSTDVDAIQASGRGTVASWILSHHPSQPDDAPRIVVLIDLAEGTRFVSNLIDIEPDAVSIGLAVEVRFVDVGGTVLPQFAPVVKR